MRFFIPEIGTEIELTKDWVINVRYESRNEKIMSFFDVKYNWRSTEYDNNDIVGQFTFKKGDVVKVDRIYVRKGAMDYSSVSLTNKKTGRFWVKLDDFNNLEGNVVDNPRDKMRIEFYFCDYIKDDDFSKLLYKIDNGEIKTIEIENEIEEKVNSYKPNAIERIFGQTEIKDIIRIPKFF